MLHDYDIWLWIKKLIVKKAFSVRNKKATNKGKFVVV